MNTVRTAKPFINQNYIFVKCYMKTTMITFRPHCLTVFSNVTYLKHGTIIRTGITCKKIPCYMRDSACRWFIVKKAKIF